MSDNAKPEPHPFERLKTMAKQILAVPLKEIDRREEEWRKTRVSNRQGGKNGKAA